MKRILISALTLAILAFTFVPSIATAQAKPDVVIDEFHPKIPGFPKGSYAHVGNTVEVRLTQVPSASNCWELENVQGVAVTFRSSQNSTEAYSAEFAAVQNGVAHLRFVCKSSGQTVKAFDADITVLRPGEYVQ